MKMRAKYVEEMNQIKVDDELKHSILSHTGYSSTESPTRIRSFWSKSVLVSAAGLIVCLLCIGGLIYVDQGNSTKSDRSAWFNEFIITAYAADGEPVMAKPNVEFPIGNYSVIMSSAPGFPVKIDVEHADQISLRITEGEILFWNASDSKVRNQGKEAKIKPGETVYLSPVENGQTAIESVLHITAYKQTEKIGSSVIEIKSDDQGTYTGKIHVK